MELLVVVLILATLMAVAVPLYLSSVADASKKTCRANMQTIANAAQSWKVSRRAPSFAGLTAVNQLIEQLGSVPLCPDDGDYQLAVGPGIVTDADGNPKAVPDAAIVITCTAIDHGGFVPGITNN